MTLELNALFTTLTYRVNNGHEFIAFSNILREKGLNYRLAVSLCDRGPSLQILEYNNDE